MCHIVIHVVYVFCFFFKQKTAYEMRISDWSSDVCSSDLVPSGGQVGVPRQPAVQGGPAIRDRAGRGRRRQAERAAGRAPGSGTAGLRRGSRGLWPAHRPAGTERERRGASREEGEHASAAAGPSCPRAAGGGALCGGWHSPAAVPGQSRSADTGPVRPAQRGLAAGSFGGGDPETAGSRRGGGAGGRRL